MKYIGANCVQKERPAREGKNIENYKKQPRKLGRKAKQKEQFLSVLWGNPN